MLAPAVNLYMILRDDERHRPLQVLWDFMVLLVRARLKCPPINFTVIRKLPQSFFQNAVPSKRERNWFVFDFTGR